MNEALLFGLRMALSRDLERIAKYFKPGVKLTLVVRLPHADEVSIIVSDDDLDDVVTEIRQRQEAMS